MAKKIEVVEWEGKFTGSVYSGKDWGEEEFCGVCASEWFDTKDAAAEYLTHKAKMKVIMPHPEVGVTKGNLEDGRLVEAFANKNVRVEKTKEQLQELPEGARKVPTLSSTLMRFGKFSKRYKGDPVVEKIKKALDAITVVEKVIE